MTSLYAKYVREREGNLVLEEPWGFIEFRLALPFMRIESIYVEPHLRKQNKATELADRIADIGRDGGATHLWTQVVLATQCATESLKAVLAYGFEVQIAQNGVIILTKEIGRKDG